jgi:5'-methylthioadenosine phosphorylase
LPVSLAGMNAIKIGVIGGTGLGQLLGGSEGVLHEVTTPFGKPSGAIVETQWEGLSVLLLQRHGAGHVLNPSRVPYRANIFALKQLGCTHLIASGACGSLRQEYKPRDLVIVDQLIDKTSRREGTFFESGAVHVEFAEPLCAGLRKVLLESGNEMAKEGDFAVHDGGCYVCMEGPAFSTRAESLMHRLWGGDVIGMTACPEAKLAREAEIPYALVALVTDYDCWKGKPSPKEGEAASPEALLNEIIANMQAASANAMGVIRGTLAKIAADPGGLGPAPAAEALKLAIWSDKASIPAYEIEKLLPLWGRYFR